MKTDLENLQEFSPNVLIVGVLKMGGLASVAVNGKEKYLEELNKFKETEVRVFGLKEWDVSKVNESFKK